MSAKYNRNAAARRADNERRLCGETLAQFHERENPARTAPGAGIPRARCQLTPNLFTGQTEAQRKNHLQRTLWEQPRIIKEWEK